MTSDQAHHLRASHAALPRAMRKKALPPDSIELGSIRLSYTQELIDLIGRHELEKDGWQRTLGGAVAVLNRAFAALEQAQSLLAEREKRIRTLEKMSSHDELTGLLNHKGFFETFLREIGRVERGSSPGGVLIMIEIDNFLSVQERFGREAAETALRLTGHTLGHEIRTMDAAARIGPDEFVVLLANADKHRALARVQHLALNLNNLSFIWRDVEISISASVGLKSFGAGDRPKDIFSAADAHLQNNKQEKKKSKE